MRARRVPPFLLDCHNGQNRRKNTCLCVCSADQLMLHQVLGRSDITALPPDESKEHLEADSANKWS